MHLQPLLFAMVTGKFGFYTAGPNTALITSGGKIAIGGRLFALPIVQRVDSLSLTLRTIMVTTAHGTTINGVAVHVTGCCQVKIRAWTAISDGPDERMEIDEGAIRLAAQHFLGHSESEIADAIRKTVEGHQRAIIGTLTIEQLYSDRNAFSLRVKDLCTEDMRNMGLAMVSYTVAEISDDQGYIEALGVRQIEKVKREATEGAAFHENLALSKGREMQAESHVKVNRERQRVIQSNKTVQVALSTAQTTIDQAVATQQKAGPIEHAEQNATLRVAKRDAEAARVHAEREVEAINVEKQRLRNEITRNVPADAGLFAKEKRAEAIRATASADALRIRHIAEAEAEAIRAKGEAKTLVLGERIQMWNEWYVANARPMTFSEFWCVSLALFI